MGERHVIQVFGLGTYYTDKCQTPGANAYEMRKLVYHAKNKWATGAVRVNHPHHPSGQPQWIGSPSEAYDYVTDLIQSTMVSLRTRAVLGAARLQFVPVPSSPVTELTMQTARWSGREISRRLEARDLGVAKLVVVNQAATVAKVDGGNPTLKQLQKNYRVLGPLEPNCIPVYLDDVVTDGDHIAAMDLALGRPARAIALTIGCTDKAERDAYELRTRSIIVSTLGTNLFARVE